MCLSLCWEIQPKKDVLWKLKTRDNLTARCTIHLIPNHHCCQGEQVWLLLLLLSCFSHVQLCATPQTAAHQAPLSLGFSRQEPWSGLPFPSPMHESGKWKLKVKSLSHVRLFATPWTAAYQAPPSIGFSRQKYWSGLPVLRVCLLRKSSPSSLQLEKICAAIKAQSSQR